MQWRHRISHLGLSPFPFFRPSSSPSHSLPFRFPFPPCFCFAVEMLERKIPSSAGLGPVLNVIIACQKIPSIFLALLPLSCLKTFARILALLVKKNVATFHVIKKQVHKYCRKRFSKLAEPNIAILTYWKGFPVLIFNYLNLENYSYSVNFVKNCKMYFIMC